jgi:ABC-type multidrug transport system permease subunit
MFEFFRITWLIMLKDLRVYLRQPTNLAVTFIPPLAMMLVQALGAAAVGRSPVALVALDAGAEGQAIAQSIRAADVFRLHEVDAAQAASLLKNLDVVAVITIPAGFSEQVLAHQPAPLEVTVNNLNLDFTNDIRRAVPDAITQYYLAQGDRSPIKVSMVEHDLRRVDVELFQYTVLPTVILLLMISGLITGGLTTAREWEAHTIKELLLSPAPAGAIVAGKVLAGFVTSFTLGMVVLGLAAGLGWIHPEGGYWLVTLGVVALVALFGAGLGVAIGASVRRIQPAIAVSIILAFYLYFLSGGVGVLAFEPDWLQSIAAFIPLTYGSHALQMAVFYSSADLLGRDVIVLAVSGLAALALGAAAVRRQL